MKFETYMEDLLDNKAILYIKPDPAVRYGPRDAMVMQLSPREIELAKEVTPAGSTSAVATLSQSKPERKQQCRWLQMGAMIPEMTLTVQPTMRQVMLELAVAWTQVMPLMKKVLNGGRVRYAAGWPRWFCRTSRVCWRQPTAN